MDNSPRGSKQHIFWIIQSTSALDNSIGVSVQFLFNHQYFNNESSISFTSSHLSSHASKPKISSLLIDLLKYFHMCILFCIFTTPTYSGPNHLSLGQLLTIPHWSLCHQSVSHHFHAPHTHKLIMPITWWLSQPLWAYGYLPHVSPVSPLASHDPLQYLWSGLPHHLLHNSFSCITSIHFVRHLKTSWEVITKAPRVLRVL